MRDTGWFKSTFSTTASDNCVEVRFSDDSARVRDSKSPNSVLSVDVPALVNAIRSGRLGA
jgi:uncharacterized protein DUF397